MADSPIPRPRHWTEAALVSAAVFLIAALYAWTATDGHGRFGTRGPKKNLYEQQVEGFHAGRLSLLAQPDPALLALPNPYDPAQNHGTRVLDVSLFEGKYFSYFGVVPILVWLWPFYAVFGRHPPADLTLWLFAVAAFVFQAMTVCRYARGRWRCPGWAQALGVLAVGTCNLLQPLVRRHDFFEIPVVAGLCFTSIALWALLRATSAPGRGVGWFALSSAALALAAGCRPNLLLLVPVPVLVAGWRAAGPGKRRHSSLRAMALAAPPACVIVLGLFAYNVARFHRPFEFGFTYQLVATDWQTHAPFDWRNAPFNLYYYVLSLPRLSPYFPYFLESALHPFAPPLGHDQVVDEVMGWLPGYPVLVVGTLALLADGWRTRRAPAGGGEWLAAIVAMFILVAAPLALFAGLSVRYQAEASLPLAILAGAAVAAVASKGGLWRGIVGATLLWTAALGFLVACETGGYFRANNPPLYGTIGRISDGLVYPVIRSAGWRPRTAVIDLRLPLDHVGYEEPLWVYGDVPEADFLYIYYVGSKTVQIGFESMGRGGPVSDYVPLDYRKPHRLELILGAFLPPPGHPYYAEHGLGEGEFCRRLLRVKIDGGIVLDGLVDFHEGRERFAWGRSEREHAFGERFSGPQFTVGRKAFVPDEVADYTGGSRARPLELSVRWPADLTDHREPILTFGAKNRGQLVFAHFLGAGKARIGVTDSTGARAEGADFPVQPGEAAVLLVDLPAFRALALVPGTLALPPMAGSAVVELNGRIVLRTPIKGFPAGPEALAVGRNSMLAGGVIERFAGDLRPISGAAPR